MNNVALKANEIKHSRSWALKLIEFHKMWNLFSSRRFVRITTGRVASFRLNFWAKRADREKKMFQRLVANSTLHRLSNEIWGLKHVAMKCNVIYADLWFCCAKKSPNNLNRRKAFWDDSRECLRFNNSTTNICLTLHTMLQFCEINDSSPIWGPICSHKLLKPAPLFGFLWRRKWRRENFLD